MEKQHLWAKTDTGVTVSICGKVSFYPSESPPSWID